MHVYTDIIYLFDTFLCAHSINKTNPLRSNYKRKMELTNNNQFLSTQQNSFKPSDEILGQLNRLIGDEKSVKNANT